MPVVVVTDSSSRLPPDERKRLNVREVPLHVLIDGTDLRDGVDDVPYDVHDRPKVTTAGATPAELVATYRQALADSAGDGVVAVHLSAALSSTYGAAVSAAREFGPAVRVVNSRSAAMGVGFVAMAAARCAAAGGDLDAVEAAARSALNRSHVYLVVHRLDNLRRSGRIRTAASWLGTALSLKPLLRLDVDGRLVLDQRIRTVTKAHAAMVERVADVVGEHTADVVVHHVDNHDAADELGAALTQRLPQISSLDVSDMGPVLSVHVGAAAVGVAVSVHDD
ncbi:EDD domain protein, DegV family [Mycolicibacterium chubuense NBB4]|uniref:EDD domain protein, DegV family n=1 Tax=Mycolicibacterium chubuense (strain NBB4) TaxID=710421 RepID=I4BLJ3_MYCCN|nr:DegV family protein [Mycolicibacterium chubuense]AFM18150.1 EDD domain protein, DegV family [Mycolicibacterium chubuense NBB4]